MTVLLDTGPLVAYLNREDPLHPRAVALVERALSGELGLPQSTDFVLDEGLTLLRRRPGRRELSSAFSSFFYGAEAHRPFLEMRATGPSMVKEAVATHLDLYERGLSFTDCTLIGHVRETGGVLASFDSGFEGVVPRVDH